MYIFCMIYGHYSHLCSILQYIGSEGGTEGEIVYIVFSISVTAFISQCTPSISDVEGLTL